MREDNIWSRRYNNMKIWNRSNIENVEFRLRSMKIKITVYVFFLSKCNSGKSYIYDRKYTKYLHVG